MTDFFFIYTQFTHNFPILHSFEVVRKAVLFSRTCAHTPKNYRSPIPLSRVRRPQNSS